MIVSKASIEAGTMIADAFESMITAVAVGEVGEHEKHDLRMAFMAGVHFVLTASTGDDADEDALARAMARELAETIEKLHARSCGTCTAWSQLLAHATGGEPVRAACLNPASPRYATFANQSTWPTAEDGCGAWTDDAGLADLPDGPA